MKLFGLFRICIYGQKIYFIIMRSVTPVKSNLHELYDLKGSTVGRKYEPQKNQNGIIIYKDLDLTRKILIDPCNGIDVVNQLCADSTV